MHNKTEPSSYDGPDRTSNANESLDQ